MRAGRVFAYRVVGFDHVKGQFFDAPKRVCFGQKFEGADSPLLFIFFPRKFWSAEKVTGTPPTRKLFAIQYCAKAIRRC
jgi:hypothetical protein